MGRPATNRQSVAVRVCPQCRSVYAGNSARCLFDDTLLVEQEHDPLIGEPLDRYRIEQRLGVGGMGNVYLARHSVLDRIYAIKVLFGDFAGHDKFQARFRREATSISKIDHPNIVRVEDFGQTPEGLTFLAMELVVGQTLERLLSTETRLRPVRAANILRQAAEGLGAAHDRGFVHRDIKPSNLMLARTPDDNEIVKILDFGAVSLRELPRGERLTAAGHIIGTPMYMPPEQSQNPNVGPTADVYTLGVVLYEMLAGGPPFTAPSRAKMIIMHMTDSPPPLPPSEGLERLVSWMLRKQPGDRPQSMKDVIVELEALGFRGKSPRRRDGTKAKRGRGDSAFHSAPTSHVLHGYEQDQLKKIYAALSADPPHEPVATPDEITVTPPEDTKPTPPEGALSNGGEAPDTPILAAWKEDAPSAEGPQTVVGTETLVVRVRSRPTEPNARIADDGESTRTQVHFRNDGERASDDDAPDIDDTRPSVERLPDTSLTPRQSTDTAPEVADTAADVPSHSAPWPWPYTVGLVIVASALALVTLTLLR